VTPVQQALRVLEDDVAAVQRRVSALRTAIDKDHADAERRINASLSAVSAVSPGDTGSYREGYGPQRGRRLSMSTLRRVAAAYYAAMATGAPVQAAVASEMGISTSMAAKRIMAARRAGLLNDECRAACLSRQHAGGAS
jgi:hypothetical protein